MFEGLTVQPSTVTENETVPSGTVSLKNKINVVPLLTFTECKTIPSDSQPENKDKLNKQQLIQANSWD